MPLKLTTIKKRADIPAYQQLANHLRQAILTGDLAPGDKLPSARQICELTGLSREPVLKALDVIIAEGPIVRAKPGLPHVVAQPRKPRIMGPARYRDLLGALRRGEPLPLQNAFTVENGAKWSDYTEHPRQFAQEAATGLDRELLQLGDGEQIWRRRFVRNLWGRPYEILRSAIPLHIAQGTILMDADADPLPGGTIEALFRKGYDPQLAQHRVVSRAPNDRERELLQIQSVDRVYDLLEVFTAADGTVLQAARTIMPTSGMTLEFETDLRAA